MKRLLLFILLASFITLAYSQSQRLVILEEFTSSTCGPCAGVNPTFHTWQVQNPDKFTSIYYHVNWPSPGDPMNLANPAENAARVSYYGVTYVPESNLDGNYYNGSASSWSMTTVNNRYAMPSPMEVSSQHWISPGQDSVYSTMLVKCTGAVSGTLIAHNVIIEKWIHFNSPPGSNGEKDFYNVMKKMLPNQNGTQLPSVMGPGDYVLLEGAWKFGTVYDKTQIASVCFVQNKNTKEIYNTCNSAVTPLVLPYNNDVQVMEVQNVPPKTCNNKITPTVRIRNNGVNTVTSLVIKYRVNNATESTFNWSGNLTSMSKVNIVLPEYQFDILATNDLRIYTTNPNNIADNYPKNDTIHYTIAAAPLSSSTMKLVLRTDNSPLETTWDVKNSSGITVLNSPAYTIANKLYQEQYTLPPADCYTFTIYDAGGNGICCSNGTGVYEVSSTNGIVIRQGGQFAASESSEFLEEAPVSVNNADRNIEMTISPMPVTGHSKITFSLPVSGEVSYRLMTALGQPVSLISLGFMGSGIHETSIDGSSLTPGIYLLQLKTETGSVTRKIQVIH